MAVHFEAPALQALNRQVNGLWPGRDRTSDGWIGDPSHAARPSDHNPLWSSGGIVLARDFDKDGLDPNLLVVAACADSRTKYVIFAGRIWQRRSRRGAFHVSRYTGVNSHHGHVHVSVYLDEARDGRPWAALLRQPAPQPAPQKPTPEEEEDMGLMVRSPAGAVLYISGGKAVGVVGDDYANWQAAGVKVVGLSQAGFDKVQQGFR